MTYKLLADQLSGKVYGAVRANTDGTATSFLFEPDNSDHKAYLAWLEAGNTPEPAPEPAPVPELTPAEKLAASGLTVGELKELLGLK